MYIEVRNDNDRKLWFRIRSIEKKIEKLGPIGSKGFNWIEWESLEEDLARFVTQLSLHRDIVKEILSRYD